jgi:hypothetical protein
MMLLSLLYSLDCMFNGFTNVTIKVGEWLDSHTLYK